MIRRVEEARRAFALHRENPPRALSVNLARRIAESLDSPPADR
jgi:hypothetical protein